MGTTFGSRLQLAREDQRLRGVLERVQEVPGDGLVVRQSVLGAEFCHQGAPHPLAVVDEPVLQLLPIRARGVPDLERFHLGRVRMLEVLLAQEPRPEVIGGLRGKFAIGDGAGGFGLEELEENLLLFLLLRLLPLLLRLPLLLVFLLGGKGRLLLEVGQDAARLGGNVVGRELSDDVLFLERHGVRHLKIVLLRAACLFVFLPALPGGGPGHPPLALHTLSILLPRLPRGRGPRGVEKGAQKISLFEH